MKRATTMQPAPCPCGAAASYAQCCAVWHAGEAAPNAETLMRSRYVAYALQLDDYVLATWHASTRPLALHPGSPSEKLPLPNFIRLEIKDYTIKGADTASVEFVAWYKSGGRAHKLREISRFVFEHDQWWYVDGEVSDN